jgi:hypothetical protein
LTGAVHRLATHLRRMRAGDISESTVHRFMALLRELLEERGDRQNYALATMFCDWQLHPKLDSSKAGSELLDILDDTWGVGRNNVDQRIGELLEGLSPRKLRDQIVLILGGAFVEPSFFLDDHSFIKFMRYLTADLVDKPISRQPREIEKLTAERLAQGYRHIADRLFFRRRKDGGNDIVLAVRQIEPPSGGEIQIVIPWSD